MDILNFYVVRYELHQIVVIAFDRNEVKEIMYKRFPLVSFKDYDIDLVGSVLDEKIYFEFYG